MIESLSIQNLILVEKAEICFGAGLNILTGETGAGKSAVLAAIRLLLGERADPQQIRLGTDLAIVEGVVHIRYTPLPDLDLPPFGHPIRLRREIHRSGRSRAFINDNLVTLQQLKQFLGRSIELVDQSTSHRLTENDEQRFLLDSYASLHSTIDAFRSKYHQQLEAEKVLSEQLDLQKSGAEELNRLTEELALINEINWQEGEEEALTAEHTLLTHSQELTETISETTLSLLENSNPIVPLLKRYAGHLERLVAIDPKIEESIQLFRSSLLGLEDAAHQLLSYANRLDADPLRLQAVEKRLGEIESLKKRYGATHREFTAHVEAIQTKIDRIANLDTEIEEARTVAATLQANNLLAVNKITQAREKAARQLNEKVAEELKELNLPHARFAVHLEPKPISSDGANRVHFLFAANPNQHLSPLDEAASGGELSRLLFALKSTIASKEESSTLILDEIDSNVGGQTAAIFGSKLQSLAKAKQLICVTHFVQVARCASHHFLVEKKTAPDGAMTMISALKDIERNREFARMTGER